MSKVHINILYTTSNPWSCYEISSGAIYRSNDLLCGVVFQAPLFTTKWRSKELRAVYVRTLWIVCTNTNIFDNFKVIYISTVTCSVETCGSLENAVESPHIGDFTDHRAVFLFHCRPLQNIFNEEIWQETKCFWFIDIMYHNKAKTTYSPGIN